MEVLLSAYSIEKMKEIEEKAKKKEIEMLDWWFAYKELEK
jgi:hypothetical protein